MAYSLIPALILSLLSTYPSKSAAFGVIKQNTNEKLHKTTPFHTTTPTSLLSTAYDISLYDDDDQNPFTTNSNPLAAEPNTKLILGINKYSHDTALCAADAATGKVLFALSKERLSRKKADSGNIATLVETCLNQLELNLDDIIKVVVNNHHHRVLPMEESFAKMEWEDGMGINGGAEGGYIDEENLLSHAEKWELSHHLAHAYSVASQCPFDTGMVVVMDGMGETYRAMKAAKEEKYVTDLMFEGEFQCIPSDIKERSGMSVFDWREAESVYEFVKNNDGLSVKPIFKRFVEEKTPPTLYNHGFHDMESVGALYSRASSHIFGNWNVCGKVMGLAPWAGYVWRNVEKDGGDIVAKNSPHSIMEGSLYEESGNPFRVDQSSMLGIPFFARLDPDLFDKDGLMIRKRRFDFDDNETIKLKDRNEEERRPKQLPTAAALDSIALSAKIQEDLELTVLDFVKHFKDTTNQDNLCLAGGVALNSVLNGRISRELGFKKIFIPPYPGDDGIAVGCCAYGIYGNTAFSKGHKELPQMWSKPLSPYLGPLYSNDEIKDEIENAAPWLEVDFVSNDYDRFEQMVDEMESGGIIAWYQGRSEFGPRALGHRSILADPRKNGVARFLNERVKKRETFRPFAPSVLAEEVGDWFEIRSDIEDLNFSPFMSMTAKVKQSKRDKIPAVTHVDGSSRLQTVTSDSEPLYYNFISTFFERTGVPMVLNTSFNTLPGEPIVESPKDAIRSFLCSMGGIDMLIMGDYVIKRKSADVRRLLGEKSDDGITLPPRFPRRAGPIHFESKFTVDKIGSATSNTTAPIETITRVRMPDSPMHNEKEGGWFTLLDDFEGQLLGVCDGSVGVNDIFSQYYVDTIESNAENIENDEEGELRDSLFGNILERLVRLYENTLISF